MWLFNKNIKDPQKQKYVDWPVQTGWALQSHNNQTSWDTEEFHPITSQSLSYFPY